MRIDVLSLFPQMFDGIVHQSMLKIAQEKGALEFYAHDLRDWTHDLHRTADDSPYGGGPGMVMKVEPLVEAIEAITVMDALPPYVIFLTPTGRCFSQEVAQQYTQHKRLLLVCGRYEGFDERALDWADECLSIGDYVLTGGEIPALAVIDAVTRLLPDVLGSPESAGDESFSPACGGLLEYPQYTRPAVFRDRAVPEVLLSGNHQAIEDWRRKQSLQRTKAQRPDLI